MSFLIQGGEKRLAVGPKRRLDADGLARDGMLEGERAAVQEHALQRDAQGPLRHRAVEFEVAVLVVAHEREADRERMHADLMRAPREKFGVEKRDGAVALQLREDRVRGHPLLFVHAHSPLARGKQIAKKRRLHVAAVVGPVAFDEQRVVLLDGARLHHVVKADERLAGLAEDDGAARFAVEPVSEFQEGNVGARSAHALDQTVGDPRASVGGEARGLVDDQKMTVFKENGHRPLGQSRGGRLRDGALGDAHGRKPQEVPFGKARLRLGAGLVHAHFARADDAVDVALRNALGDAHEEIVEALAVRVGTDPHKGNAVRGKRREARGVFGMNVGCRHESVYGREGTKKRFSKCEKRPASTAR